MDVDAQFPSLSSFVQSKTKRALNQYGAGCKPKKGDYWNLESSCWAVLTDRMRWKCDPYQTLKTLDEFIRRLPPKTPTHTIWIKISAKGSGFLDTVVEATWALYFWANGNDVTLEQPLDPNKPKGKNADLVVTLNGIKHWLDATSIKLNESDFPVPTVTKPFVQMRPDADLLAKLADKARDKYEEKFGTAVRSGLLKNASLGVLLCVVKSEQEVLPAFNFGFLSPPPPPPGLLDDKRPGLNLVWVHSLEPSQDSDILQPWVIAKWSPT
jgi:hypothetical protein